MDKETIDYIDNVLRQGTITWAGRTECLNRGRRQRNIGTYQNGNPILLWERPCDGCGDWHLLKDKLLEVDHIVEIGPFSGDWNIHILKMYCDQSNLQALCHSCHTRKTSKFNATLNYQRKSKSVEDPNALDAL